VSASNQGKVPPVRKFGGQPSIEKEAFGLKPGELSGIVATGGKYLILRCQGFTEPVVTDPDAVREELVRDLSETRLNRAMSDRFEQLRDSAEIDNYLPVSSTPQVATRPQ
jgi:parvulin-like peptidyl-prolyl isomerase